KRSRILTMIARCPAHIVEQKVTVDPFNLAELRLMTNRATNSVKQLLSGGDLGCMLLSFRRFADRRRQGRNKFHQSITLVCGQVETWGLISGIPRHGSLRESWDFEPEFHSACLQREFTQGRYLCFPAEAAQAPILESGDTTGHDHVFFVRGRQRSRCK